MVAWLFPIDQCTCSNSSVNQTNCKWNSMLFSFDTKLLIIILVQLAKSVQSSAEPRQVHSHPSVERRFVHPRQSTRQRGHEIYVCSVRAANHHTFDCIFGKCVVNNNCIHNIISIFNAIFISSDKAVRTTIIVNTVFQHQFLFVCQQHTLQKRIAFAHHTCFVLRMCNNCYGQR